MQDNVMNKRVLKNGIEIDQMNDYETDFIYNEIFEEKVYLKNGVILKADSCIFDVGSNIGLFSLYNLMNYEKSQVYAFEPSPQLCSKIKYNTRNYSDRIHIHQCGLSNKEGKATFSFYPGYSIISGFKTDKEEDLKTIKSGILGENQVNDEFEEQCLNEMLENKLKDKVEYDCTLKTISSVIREEKVEIIDLLKIDAEKSEMEILAGIEDKDWDIIMQLIMEVHDIDNVEKGRILNLLESKGYEVIADEEDELQGSGIVNFFASKKGYKEKYGEKTDESSNIKKVNVVANFSIDPLYEMNSKILKEFDFKLDIEYSDYNQVFQELLNPQSLFSQNESGSHIILIKPDEWAHYQNNADKAYLYGVADQFIEAVANFACQVNTPVIVLMCPVTEKYKDFYRYMIEELDHIQRVVVVDAATYHSIYNIDVEYNELTNEMGHLPYSNEYYQFISVLMIRYLFNENFSRLKMIITDCDNTLWQGICAESSVDELVIGVKEKKLQEFLVKKYNEGFIIGICSKNNEKDVMNVFENNHNMVLKKEHITAYKINWALKSENIKALANELNIGMDSIMMIDDNPAECSEIIANCGSVIVLRWPFPDERSIEHIWRTDKNKVIDEDKKRNDTYKWNLKINNIKENSTTYKQFIDELKIDIAINEINEDYYDRASQLTLKTNQFNFTTLRRNVNEIIDLKKEGKTGYVVSVKDKFGDYGIVSFFVLQKKDERVVLESFLLSCRVLGRGIENKIFTWIADKMRAEQVKEIEILYNKSEKNTPAKEFLDNEYKEYYKVIDGDSGKYIVPIDVLIESEENFMKSLIVKKERKNSSVSEALILDARAYESIQQKIFEKFVTSESRSKFFNDNKNENNNIFVSKDINNINDQNETVDTVKSVFSKVLNIPVEKIFEEEEIDKYIHKDSMKVIAITVELKKIYSDISPVLLYKNRTISQIASALDKSNKTVSCKEHIMDSAEEINDNDVAIIGLNLRFAGADNAEEFWNNLKNGVCTIGEIPAERWDVSRYYDASGQNGKYYNKNGGFLNDVDKFDASFFCISPLEAETMDPQQRIMLEIAEGLFQDAGYTKSTIGKNTGVFIGAISNDYSCYANEAALNGNCVYRDVDYYQIANRISYTYDLNGPSITVDTACSSSGTALYYALRSIQNKDCDAAIVGGVNLFLHPGRFIQYSSMKVLSTDGVLRPFSNRSSGTVYGEGAAAILIKPLKKAVEDRDHIYAVIKGCAVNSAGKTNGFTVPSPRAQTELICRTLEDANVSADEISYFEAHGTGTSLGDPIEIEGITDAYKSNAEKCGKKFDKQFCPIGSVKSNIGHTESVATLAGISKILLQMKYGMLVPTLNVGTLNQYIPFEDSPVFVQQKLEQWKRKHSVKNGVDVEIPRRAAISSFGAGGSNAHFIIEEYIPTSDRQNSNKKELLFVFSAPSEHLLKNYIKRCADHFDAAYNGKCSDSELESIAYTLQCGRKTYRCKLAIIADNIYDLNVKCRSYLLGASNELYCLAGDSDTNDFLSKDIPVSASLRDIAEEWINGTIFTWECLYRNYKPYKVSLPQVGFERESFWIECGSSMKESADILIDKYCEGLNEIVFSKVFSVDNTYIKEHIINNECILPGAAYFELLFEAFKCIDMSINDYVIYNICWMSVLKIRESVKLNISFEKKEKEINCTFWSTKNNEKTVHSVMHIRKRNADIEHGNDMRMDGLEYEISRTESYRLLSEKKYNYGESYRVVESVIYNSERAFAILSQKNSWNEISLAPNIIDGALQAVSLWVNKTTSGFNGTFIPYTMDNVYIYGSINKCGSYCVFVKTSEDSINTNVKKYDIYIYNEAKKLLMVINGYYTRNLNENDRRINNDGQLYLFAPVSEYKDITDAAEELKENILVCTGKSLLYQRLQLINSGNTYFLKTNNGSVSEEECNIKLNDISIDEKDVLYVVLDFCHPFSEYYDEIKNALGITQNLCKAVIATQIKQAKIICIYNNDDRYQTVIYKALSAALNVIKEESAKIKYQCIGVPESYSASDIAKVLGREINSNDLLSNVVYKPEGRMTTRNEIISDDFLNGRKYNYGERKVYLITGGLGGLGYETALHIANNSKNAILCLVGRSDIDESKRQKLFDLEKNAYKAEYFKADISDKNAVRALIESIKLKYGKVNGVFHLAGALNDSLLIHKNINDEEKVIMPKALGAVYLDDTLANEELDIFVMFSSTSSLIPHIGQCDYAYANRFLDDFCEVREKLRSNNARKGKTFSINWSLWKNGGMSVGFEELKRIEKQYGLNAIETDEGMSILDNILSSDKANIGVIIGQKDKIKHIFSNNYSENSVADKRQYTVRKEIDLENTAINIIKSSISKVIKYPENKIKKSDSFSQYGFDSITFTSLANEIGNEIDSIISPAFFYEYTTIEKLAKHFCEKNMINVNDEENEIIVSENDYQVFGSDTEIRRINENTSQNDDDDIVIVGMSGTFPGADNIWEFYNNLLEKKCSMSIIPADRWDWRACFGKNDNQTEINKGGFIRNAASFDAEFFGISPKEAMYMDPQQRLFLQSAWQCIEDAGHNPRELSGKNVGVFAAASINDYNEVLKDNEAVIDPFISAGVNNSIIANRVSYILNLHGPSEVIDTACSSSLIALKHAVEALKNNECDSAVVGGVNIISRPKFFISFGKAGMLSKQGRCATFDESADGYARGEGVATLYIKKKAKAIEDNDHIYAIICGVSENHGGKSHSLTAPNPQAQADVIRKAYETTNVDMSKVAYIECHGTGTSIGDPIEINGLKEAFSKDKSGKHCLLGALKANIGHLECASGAAGLIKIAFILSKKIVPGISGYNKMNPYINLDDSPFELAVENTVLKNKIDKNNNIAPLYAGISAFGFGGTNAHAVLKEYIAPGKCKDEDPAEYYIVPFSARTKNSLNRYVVQFKQFIENNTVNVSIGDIAYTLQVGREPMKERLVFIVKDLSELKRSISAYLSNNKYDTVWYEGTVSDMDNTASVLIDDSVSEIARKWVMGNNVDLNRMYNGKNVNRCSLPTYCFEESEYWYKSHNENIDLSSEYTVTLTGNEYFLRDHIIQGHKVLPGVVHMSIVCEAVKSLINKNVSGFEKICYLDAVVADETIILRCSLESVSDDRVKFRIYSSSDKTHCQGIAVIGNKKTADINIDIDTVRSSMNKYLSGNEFYDMYKKGSFNAVRTFQCLDNIRYNDSEIFASLKIADEGAAHFYDNDQIFFPAFYDSALQSTAVLTGYFGNNRDEYIPFLFEKVNLYASLPEESYVYIKRMAVYNEEQIFNVYIVDRFGNVVVSFEGYHARRFRNLVKNDLKLSFVKSSWASKEIKTNGLNIRNILVVGQNFSICRDIEKVFQDNSGKAVNVEFISTSEQSDYALNKKFIPDVVIYDDAFVSESFEKSIELIKTFVFGLQKEICLNFKEKQIEILYFVNSNNNGNVDHNKLLVQALTGFARSMSYEYRNKYHKVVCIEDNIVGNRTELIYRECSCFDSFNVVYDHNGRKVCVYEQTETVDSSVKKNKLPLKNNATYIVTGGLGALGTMIIKHLLENNPLINIIIIGSSKLDSDKVEKIHSLFGSNVRYQQADLAEYEQVIAAIRSAESDIKGVIHCAGKLNDSLLINKDISNIGNILAPKLKGAYYLDKALKDCDIDFFVMFSSVSGFAGNQGQTDYSFANSFLDNFARERNKLAASGRRSGLTYSIAWPFWKDGGMRQSKESQEYILNTTGMNPLDAYTGIGAFDMILCSEVPDFIGVVYGDTNAISKWLNSCNSPHINLKHAAGNEENNDSKAIFEKEIYQIIASMLAVDTEKLRSNIKLEELGMDSFLYVELSNKINEKFGIDTLPSIFFEYSTAYELVDGIWNEYKSELKIETGDVIETSSLVCSDITTEIDKDDPVVIVGMDVRLPNADNAYEFWDALVNNKKLIDTMSQKRLDLMGDDKDFKQMFDKICSSKGGFINDIDSFDAKFFHISKKEAAYLDPQQRLLLQSAWKTVEDAGYRASELSGENIGVYIGIAGNDYYDVIKDANVDMDAYLLTGNMAAFAANRISYVFDLKGPSEPINTACSSSLAAFGRALDDIRSNKCKSAIVGGANLLMNRRFYEATYDSGVLSESGCCKTLEQDANGYVRGEGVGTFLLKKLSDAKKAHDHIYCIVREVGVNHGGHTSSITAPSETRQKELIVDTYRSAGVPFNTLGFVEMHGTGTKLGDPIEFQALKKAAKELSDTALPMKNVHKIGLTSAKTTVGHLEAAAGVAGIAKALLSIKNKKMTGNIDKSNLNQYVKLEDSDFYVISNTVDWKDEFDGIGRIIPRRVGISSFGIGGLNAHAILEEYMERNEATINDGQKIVVLSAKTKDALKRSAQNLHNFIQREESNALSLADIAYTLFVGREEMPVRFAAVVNSKDELLDCLYDFINERNVNKNWISNEFSSTFEMNNNYHSIAKNWIVGDNGLNELFSNGSYNRVSLPTYPFDTEQRYWIKSVKESRVSAAENNIIFLNSKYTAKMIDVSKSSNVDSVIVFSASQSFVKDIQDRFHNTSVVKVTPGDKYAETDGNSFVIDVWNEHDYEKVIRSFSNNINGTLAVIAYDWCDDLFDKAETAVQILIRMLRGCMVNEKSVQFIYGYNCDSSLKSIKEEALSGLLKTARIEDDNFHGHIVGIGNDVSCNKFADILYNELFIDESEPVKYLNGVRYIRCIEEFDPKKIKLKNEVFKQGGVYLLIGGTGGIGKIIINNLLPLNSTLIITGRRSANEVSAYMNELDRLSVKAEYITCDVSDRNSVEALKDHVLGKYGHINGLIYLAGVNKDEFIFNKTDESIKSVIDAKINGIINFDIVLADVRLDYFIIMSSIAGIMGNNGQSDYAYANSFLDLFAYYRNDLCERSQRSGKTVTIAWSYWKKGGMMIPESVFNEYEKAFDIAAIPDREGIKSLNYCLNSNESFHAVMYGGESAFIKMKQTADKNKLNEIKNTMSGIADKKNIKVDRAKAADYLYGLFASLLGMEREEIDGDTLFNEYGIDSIIIQKFNRIIGSKFTDIPKTLLFDKGTINDVLNYIVENAKPLDEELKIESEIYCEEKSDVNADALEKVSAGIEKTNSDIAIIGMSCDYPKSQNIEQLWENLKNGKDCITEIPEDRWDWKEYDDSNSESSKNIYCHFGGFLDNADKFDPYVFGISPREAVLMDPQERILLEQVWSAFEQAGCADKYLSRNNGKKQENDVGIFIGSTTQTYSYRLLDYDDERKSNAIKRFSATTPWSLANRISYTFGFKGPSYSVDTACSSSLAALKLAYDSLKNGDCSLAVVGGVNMYMHPYKYANMCSMGMLSKSGHCHTFGADADGFVPGEGIGVLILKRLEDAVVSGDHVFGVIKGGCINNGVSANGFTVPNPNDQADTIKKALESANISPEDVSYIEAHGTGTLLGDPIEINGIENVLKECSEEHKCHVGSIKSNIGHLESASGVASVIKVLLQFENKMLVPSICCEKLNENIDFEKTHIIVQKKTEYWERVSRNDNGNVYEIPRIAGVSSFGVGGSNVHILLQEYDNPVDNDIVTDDNKPYIFVLSAEDKQTLLVHSRNMLEYMQKKVETQIVKCDIDILKNDILKLVADILSINVEDIDCDTTLEEYCCDIFLMRQLTDALNEKYGLVTEYENVGDLSVMDIVYKLENNDILDIKSVDTKWFRSFCYTLQTGRVALDERLAFETDSLEDAINKLKAYIENSSETEGVFCSHCKKIQNIDSYGNNIPKAWSIGSKINWETLYDGVPKRLYDLPQYPFNKSSYWINKPESHNEPEKEIVLDKTDEIKIENNTPKITLGYKKTVVKKVPKEVSQMKKDEVLNNIKRMLSEVLYLEISRIDVDKAFIDLGLDSILGVEFVNKINKEYKLGVKATKIYDYPSVDEFSVFIASELEEKSEIVSEEPEKTNVEPVVEKKPTLSLNKPVLKTAVELVEKKTEKKIPVAPATEPEKKPVCVKRDDDTVPAKSSKIAVIGMSLRTPGADNVDEFWELISNGRCSVEDVKKERWDIDKYYDPTGTKKNMSYCKKAGTLSGVGEFDPLFFNIAPNEAKNIDPQQRMFLEEAYKTFENAGYSNKKLSGYKCGVYVGVASINEYNTFNMFNTSSILASRIAYFLNLKGPALAIDTACSSSMVAIHMACSTLFNNEADMMLAGGVSIYLTEKLFIQMSEAGMLSKDGVCRPFSDDANGFVASEAVGAVLLKRLDDAVRDGDNILGIISCSETNQDGKTNGITAPSALSQEELEVSVYEKSGINPEKITMVEAHGTGTNLGDPIEFEALNKSFSRYTNKKGYCALGSVKANIGHTAATAGLVSLIKVLLCMNKKKIPPQINFSSPNRYIDLDDSQFYINKSLKSWQTDEEGKLYAAISSFGFSGTNVHAVVENYEKTEKSNRRPPEKPYYLICLSAESKNSLISRVNDLIDWLDNNKDAEIGDVAYTLIKCRSHMRVRIAFVVSGMRELKNKLVELSCEGLDSYLFENNDNQIINLLKPMTKELSKILAHELKQDDLSDEEYYDKLMALATMFRISFDPMLDICMDDKEHKKLSLPSYKFDNKFYWRDEARTDEQTAEIPAEVLLKTCTEKKTLKLNVKPKYESKNVDEGDKITDEKKCNTDNKCNDVKSDAVKPTAKKEISAKKSKSSSSKQEKKSSKDKLEYSKDDILSDLMNINTGNDVEQNKQNNKTQEAKLNYSKDDILSDLMNFHKTEAVKITTNSINKDDILSFLKEIK